MKKLRRLDYVSPRCYFCTLFQAWFNHTFNYSRLKIEKCWKHINLRNNRALLCNSIFSKNKSNSASSLTRISHSITACAFWRKNWGHLRLKTEKWWRQQRVCWWERKRNSFESGHEKVANISWLETCQLFSPIFASILFLALFGSHATFISVTIRKNASQEP